MLIKPQPTLKGNYSYFDNRDNATINADSFNVTADSFLNETNSTITANECNIIYTTSYTDNGTITCNDEIEVIDIARPDANGLSNNSYTDFNILNSGIVLNNSDLYRKIINYKAGINKIENTTKLETGKLKAGKC